MTDIEIPAEYEERNFEDGEHKAWALENVRGTDVLVKERRRSDNQLQMIYRD